MNLNRSIQILLSSSVMGEKGVSIALYELSEQTKRLHLCGLGGDTASTPWTRELLAASQENERVQVHPIETEGRTIGVLCVRTKAGRTLSKQSMDKITSSSASLASLLALSRKIRSYDNLASEISALHLELADQKISDRARGLLGEEEAAQTIIAHVNRVSESLKFVDELHAAIEDIRSQLTSRQLLHQAKEKLQKDQGISEEEAYLTLRHMSRRTRTPLGEIAKHVLGQNDTALPSCQ